MSAFLKVNATLFERYLQGLSLLRELPLELRSPAEVARRMQEGKNFTIEVPRGRGIVARYEQIIESAKDSVRKEAPALPPFQSLQVWLFSLRILAIGLALCGYPFMALLLSCGQYIAAPCSLFVSCAMFAALAPPLFLGHYAVWSVLQGISNILLPWWLQPSIPINMLFIVALLTLDQAICFRLTKVTPMGAPAELAAGALFTHVWYGFLNCKTYELLILLCARSWGCRINLAIWLIDAYFGLSKQLRTLVEEHLGTWAFLFYTQHRMGHLPKVYESAHKFHHTFRDSTAFDAHLYGSGMPEELVCILVEALGSKFGVCPMSLGHNGLTQSWSNKLGHTRKQDGAGGMNDHADHHKEHMKNFGFGNPMLDMLFNTRCDSQHAEYGAWKVVKIETDEVVRFEWSATSGGKDVEGIYHNPILSRDLLAMVRNQW